MNTIEILADFYKHSLNITKFPMYKRAKHKIGYLAQEPSVFTKLSVEDNLNLVLETSFTLSSSTLVSDLGARKPKGGAPSTEAKNPDGLSRLKLSLKNSSSKALAIPIPSSYISKSP